MMMDVDSQMEAEVRKRVEERLEQRREVYGHITAYVFVNIMLWSIWAFTGADSMWPLWVTGFWGMGVVGHFMDYYNKHGAGRKRFERQVEREMMLERERLYAAKRKNDEYYDDDSLFYDDDDDLQQRR